MKLELPPEILKDELASVVSVVDKSDAARPMLDMVLIEPGEKYVRFTAGDGVVSMESNLAITKEIKVTEGRTICLPARKILDLVSLMSGGVVKLSIATDGNVTVKHGKSTYRMRSVDGTRYPQPTDKFEELYSVAAGEVLKKFIKLTRGFIGEDDSRFAFSGGMLECGDGKIRMVGTDGARLAVAEHTHADFDGLASQSVLIPNKSLAALAKMVKKGEPVRVAFAKDAYGVFRKVKFRVGSRFLTTNLTAGKFPQWEAMLPKERQVSALLDRTELLNSLKRSLIVSDFRSRFIELRFTKDGVAIKTDGNDDGEEVLACEYKHGEAMPDVRVGVNADYVTQFLGVVPEVLDGNGVLLSYAGQSSFVEINPEAADCEFRYLIAPVRI